MSEAPDLLRRWPFALIYLPEGEGKGKGPVVVALAHHKREVGYWSDRLPPTS